MSVTGPRFREYLLVKRIASLFGLKKLSEEMPGRDIYPPYLLMSISLLLDFGVIQVYRHLFTENQHIFAITPTAVVGLIALILAAVGIRYMSDEYADAIDALPTGDEDNETDMDMFKRTFPYRAKLAIYGTSAVALFLYTVFGFGVSDVVGSGLPTDPTNWLTILIWIAVYLPFVVEFALVYFAIHFLVPRYIRDADIGLFFYDPRNMGGFAPIGQLLKRSYYLYTIGLLLFFIATYGPFVLSIEGVEGSPGRTPALFFSTAWFVGVISIGHSMMVIHRIMSTEKEESIRKLEEEIRDIVENPHDITSSGVRDENELDDLNRRLDRVRETRVYPASFTMWSQIAISVILPQALQVAFNATT